MSPRVTVVRATSKHVAQLAPTLRPEDLAECVASGFSSASEALARSMEASVDSWAVLFDAEVVAMVGVDPFKEKPDAAVIWAVTGEGVTRSKLSFLRASHAVIGVLLKRYGVLVNLVDARYQGALDWLECLGFVIGRLVPHPVTGAPFRAVLLRRA